MLEFVTAPVRGRFCSMGKYTGLARIAFLSKLAYSSDVLARTCFIAMVLFIFAQLWQRALPGGSHLAGFTGMQMVWYLLATESIALSSPRVQDAISNDVKSGAIAYQLIRPYSYIGYYISVSLGEFLVRWPANIVIGSIIARVLVGAPPLQPAHLALTLLHILLGAALSALFVIALGLTAFWFEENRPFFWIYTKLLFTLGGLFVPVEIYPDFLSNAARWLPFEYMISAPARLFVRFEWTFWQRVLLGQILWLAGLGLIALLMYRAGVKRVHVQGG